ncbi:MAG TPA: ABC transporter ATP-binding protein [Bacillota bacterium]|nr:ABC transporter ATP-binding protein [Bacillota bacterium]HOH09858.1 ABC transporter ATP-binding protein [Bacillota bacterium]HOY88226.1 ABC transporter ATP-binding protein [Bacillota bacterium]HPI00729.1 ABC transporter ATP-binding protein [Bacillota bacterium]HPM64238.1 ABC transporter ATP-binding protein [Bacillota bacterium]
MLDIKDISVNYGGISALSDVSMHIEEGEVVAVVGSNGAGKSTLLRAISGLVPITEGKISFSGTDIEKMKPHKILRLGISHVPEGRLLFGKMSVHDNLLTGAFTLSSNEAIASKVQQVYEMFPRLKERCSQKAETLSGGEQQMLAIGRALMVSPKLLMLDEPSLGLSPILVEQVIDLVKKLKAGKQTVLLVEQNVRKALGVADRAYVLQTGKIALSGTGEELLASESVKKAYLGM